MKCEWMDGWREKKKSDEIHEGAKTRLLGRREASDQSRTGNLAATVTLESARSHTDSLNYLCRSPILLSQQD